MATRCIWPPDICEGFLLTWSLQADLVQGIERALAALGAGDARQREGQLDVGEDLWWGIRL